MLGLDLGHLSAGEVKHLLAEQLQDDHVVLTEALAGPTGANDVCDEGGPVFGPLLFQDLHQQNQRHMIVGRKNVCFFFNLDKELIETQRIQIVI